MGQPSTILAKSASGSAFTLGCRVERSCHGSSWAIKTASPDRLLMRGDSTGGPLQSSLSLSRGNFGLRGPSSSVMVSFMGHPRFFPHWLRVIQLPCSTAAGKRIPQFGQGNSTIRRCRPCTSGIVNCRPHPGHEAFGGRGGVEIIKKPTAASSSATKPTGKTMATIQPAELDRFRLPPDRSSRSGSISPSIVFGGAGAGTSRRCPQTVHSNLLPATSGRASNGVRHYGQRKRSMGISL